MKAEDSPALYTLFERVGGALMAFSIVGLVLIGATPTWLTVTTAFCLGVALRGVLRDLAEKGIDED